MRTVSSMVGSCRAIFWKRRDSARSFSICLYSSNVVDPTTRRPPPVSTGLSSVARSIVPPVVAPAPTMLWSSSMNRIGFLRLPQGREDGLEPLFEVAAEARAGQQRRRVEREDLGAGKRRRHVALQQALREPLGHGGLADAGVADEDRAVLPAPAQHFERALQFLLPPDQRVEQAGRGALGQVDAVGGERVARHRRRLVVAGGHRLGHRPRRAGRPAGRAPCGCRAR